MVTDTTPPERIWAEPDGSEIIIHNGDPNLEALIRTGYLFEYVREDLQGWRDMESAPKGSFKDAPVGNKGGVKSVHQPVKILAQDSEGNATISYWVDAEGRWCMFTKGVPPRAWMPMLEATT